MTTSKQTVLVFGPTGGVGCATAIEAHRRGAHVWLAMRDTSKAIAGLSEAELQSDRYSHIQADLSKPDTLKHAVQQSGATSAFVYTIFGSQDNMRGAFDALRDAGITYIALLSSHAVKGLAEDAHNAGDLIAGTHAKTELALKDSGIPSTAVRPAYFTSNVFWYTDGIRRGAVQLLYPDVKFDYISPTDIGSVCGALLGETRFRIKNNGSIPLCGPELHTQREAMKIIGQVLGREIEIEELSEDAWYEKQLQHMPQPVVDAITGGMRASHEGHDAYPDFAELSGNISKYTEREAVKLADWIRLNRAAFE